MQLDIINRCPHNIIYILFIFLNGCSIHEAKLNESSESYSQYKYLIDQRQPNRSNLSSNIGNFTEKTLELVSLGSLSPYATGSTRFQSADMEVVSDSTFSISPALSFDMQIDKLAKVSKHPIEKVYLSTLTIRASETYVGTSPDDDHADCSIKFTYKNYPFTYYDSTRLNPFDHYKSLGGFVNRCIAGAAGFIGDFYQTHNN